MSNSQPLQSQQALESYFDDLLNDSASAEPAFKQVDEHAVKQDFCSESNVLSASVNIVESTPITKVATIKPKIILSAPIKKERSALLTEPQASCDEVPDNQRQQVQQLLNQVTLTQYSESVESRLLPKAEKTATEQSIEKVTSRPVIQRDEAAEGLKKEKVNLTAQPIIKTAEQSDSKGKVAGWCNQPRGQAFQVLYFDVKGVIFAVPLDELGGIHRMNKLNHLIGRPSWYLGLQTSELGNINVVDTAKWVMAEKLNDESHASSYEYVVMLANSHWGLACHYLKGTELLQQDQVRWREKAAKRPWLAGMVTEKMCALIHVKALIDMLKNGLDVKMLTTA